jgi:endonuclease YncB( thermonuclease family)
MLPMPLPCVPALALSFLGLLMAAGTAGAAKPAAPAPLQGAVTQVIDGDTVRFSVPGQAAIDVRLASIDAPELCQPWGPEARKALIDLALNKPATLRTTGRDGPRTVGVLTVEGLNISQRLVEEGHAWSVRGRNGRGPFMKQERMAQSLTRGLHAGGGAVYPADFRRDRGPCR